MNQGGFAADLTMIVVIERGSDDTKAVHVLSCIGRFGRLG